VLALLVAGPIVQVQGQRADWAREARRHVVDRTDRPVGEASRNNGCLVDAGSSVWAGERV
jgi:hypothetical protein